MARLAEGPAQPALQQIGTRVSTPDFALQGGGGVGVGNNSPFGNQFGAYADILRNRVAQYWRTTDIRAANNAPVVGVTFVLHRDGSGHRHAHHAEERDLRARYLRAARRHGRCRRFPQLPPQFPKSEAEIEFLFQLKR